MLTQKTKILYLIDCLDTGGTEQQLILLAENLPRHRFEPVIATLKSNDYQRKLKLRTRVIDLGVGGMRIKRNIQLVLKIRDLLDEECFDIVQTQFVESSIYGALASRFSRTRPILIGTRRNLYHWVKDGRWSFRFLRYTLRWTDYVLVNSCSAYQKCLEIEGIPSHKLKLIPNGVEVERFSSVSSEESRGKLGLKAGDLVIGVVANLRPVKGLPIFLRAAARILRELPSARFLIVGNGPQRKELLALSRDLGFTGQVTFLGNKASITEVVPAFDIAVQSSLSESFSNALIEYMAAQKPIVATRVGDAEKILDHDKDGLLVDPGDPIELASAILRLAHDREKRVGIALSARRKVEARWALPTVLGDYIDFYQGVGGQAAAAAQEG